MWCYQESYTHVIGGEEGILIPIINDACMHLDNYATRTYSQKWYKKQMEIIKKNSQNQK